jgi:pimeloyl-ACP methyl ester carboxylesterase
MKRLFFFLNFFFYFIAAYSQTYNWSAFNQSIDASPFLGKKFRIEAAVKVQQIDSSSEAEIWTRVDRPDKKMGFFYNMMDKPIRSNEWKTYSIEGKIAKDATRLFFGGLYNGKAQYFFDEFRLYVESSNGNWTEIELPDNGFESDTTVLSAAWKYARFNTNYQTFVTGLEFYKGQRSLQIDGTKATTDTSFGNKQSAGKYAAVNNIKIYYEMYGDGEPLLLLHGNSSSISSFNKQIPELSKYFKVIAVDTRGQGKSTEDGKRYTYDLFAEDMNALLEYLQLDSVNIVGWSDGGNTGLILAMRHPDKVKKLVTMGANIFIDHSVVENWVFKLLNKEKRELQGDSTPASINRLRLIELLLTEPRHQFEELGSIQSQVLVIAGEKDVIKLAHTKGIAAAIPGSHLFIAPKETHYLPQENAGLFNQTVVNFLKENK